jgi:hypothetical protein
MGGALAPPMCASRRMAARPWFETAPKKRLLTMRFPVSITPSKFAHDAGSEPFHPTGSAEGRCLTRNDELGRWILNHRASNSENACHSSVTEIISSST